MTISRYSTNISIKTNGKIELVQNIGFFSKMANRNKNCSGGN